MSRRRLFLHVGTPKSGTSYLQDKLARNSELLHQQRFDYVRTRTGNHFEAALDLLGQRWAGAEAKARGQWDALVLEGRRTRDHLIVSHEILAGADEAAVRRALDSFPDHEVHVVLTARDLGRQIPAEWQERVKHRARPDFAAYVQHNRRHHGSADPVTPFWRVQEVPRILRTWGADLPPERVHLVTVGHPGGPKGQLWKRFAGVLGLDTKAPWKESRTTNASLGGAEITLLRKLNSELAELELPRAAYIEWVRGTLVKDVLAKRPNAVRATVPPQSRAWVEQLSSSWIEAIEEMGVHVVGDLDELRPVWPDDEDGWTDPDAVDPALLAELAIESLAHVIDRIGTRPAEVGRVSKIARRLRP